MSIIEEKINACLIGLLPGQYAQELRELIYDDTATPAAIFARAKQIMPDVHKSSEYDKNTTITTDKFKTENDLNIFIMNVKDMRKVQNDFEQCTSTDIETKRKTRLSKRRFEQQVDRTLEAMPKIAAIFL